MKTELKEIPLDQIRASKTNPRKDFTSPAAKTYLEELAATIRTRGVKQPALVRPDYCLGTHTRAQIEAKRKEPIFYVLIAGECRLRASALAGKQTLPCLPEEATDDDALETQQIENLQRRDLSALEEAAGYEAMLALKAEDGKSPRYTVATLAEKIGRSENYIHKRRTLDGLPDIAREALASGVLPVRTAELIASVPSVEARKLFAKAVLKPQYEPGPLSFRDAAALKQREFVVSLKGAPFPLEDAELHKAAGACAGCPKMSANCAHLLDAEEANAHLKGRSCFDPACFKKKLALMREKQFAAAKARGLTLLDKAECEKIFPPHWGAGQMNSSTYVYLSAQPNEYLLKNGTKRIGSWKALVEEAEAKTGGKVPRVLAEDQAGTLCELIDSRLAIALIEKAAGMVEAAVVLELIDKSSESEDEKKKARAKIEASGRAVDGEVAAKTVAALYEKGADKKAVAKIQEEMGESIFAKNEPGVRSGGSGSSDAARKAEQAAAKRRLAVAFAGLTMVHAKLVKTWVASALWEAMWGNALYHAGSDGLWLIAKWKKLELGEHGTEKEKSVTAWAKTLPAAERQALVPLLFVATGLKWNGAGCEGFADLAAFAKIDVKDVEAQGAADLKAAKAAKEKKKTGETDPKILAQWTKAHGLGMPPEEIARSFKADIKDVCGALGIAVPKKKSLAVAVGNAVAAVKGSVKKPAKKK